MRKFNKIKYVSIPKLNVTKAIISITDLEHEFGEYFYELYAYCVMHKISRLEAVTYCNMFDAFDEVTGRIVARNKLYKRIYALKKKIISKHLNEIIKEMTQCNEDLKQANNEFTRADTFGKVLREEDIEKINTKDNMNKYLSKDETRDKSLDTILSAIATETKYVQILKEKQNGI